MPAICFSLRLMGKRSDTVLHVCCTIWLLICIHRTLPVIKGTNKIYTTPCLPFVPITFPLSFFFLNFPSFSLTISILSFLPQTQTTWISFSSAVGKEKMKHISVEWSKYVWFISSHPLVQWVRRLRLEKRFLSVSCSDFIISASAAISLFQVHCQEVLEGEDHLVPLRCWFKKKDPAVQKLGIIWFLTPVLHCSALGAPQ